MLLLLPPQEPQHPSASHHSTQRHFGIITGFTILEPRSVGGQHCTGGAAGAAGGTGDAGAAAAASLELLLLLCSLTPPPPPPAAAALLTNTKTTLSSIRKQHSFRNEAPDIICKVAFCCCKYSVAAEMRGFDDSIDSLRKGLNL